MENKLIDIISEAGFVYQSTNEVHSGTVLCYVYYPWYLDSFYRFVIITEKTNKCIDVSIVLVHETSADRVFSRRFYPDIEEPSTVEEPLIKFVNSTFINELRDFKLKKLLCSE